VLFFYGTLCHPPLLAAVLGRAVEMRPATLADHRVVWAEGEAFPLILPAPGATAPGMLVAPAGAEDLARIDFYEAGFGYDLVEVTPEAGGAPVAARLYRARDGLWPSGAEWSLADWVARHAERVVAAAAEYLALWPDTPPERAAALYPQILQRADSRQRAAADALPRGIRAGGGEVQVLRRRVPYRNFFELVEADLRFPRFDGSPSETVTRAAFVGGDAVTVLPYDPVRDRVLLIEQFRFAPLVRNDPCPWSLEPVAGRIDPGETPAEAARRETSEEAGLALDRLLPIGRYYPSPGAVTEYLYSFLALADLPDAAAGFGGLSSEAEDIRILLLPFADLMALVDGGGAENGPLIISALQLARHREALRG